MSSVRGPTMCGKRSRSVATIPAVSSTERVVCVAYASFRVGASSSTRACSTVSTRMTASGAWPRVPDQEHEVPVRREAADLGVHLADERARRVDRRQPSLGRPAMDAGLDAVCGEHEVSAFRNVELRLDEDGAARLQVGDDVRVVDDVLAHVHGRAECVERVDDCRHGTVDTRAESAWFGEKYALHQCVTYRPRQ